MSRIFALVVVLLTFVPASISQCDIPKSQFEQEPNIFTPEQEAVLGDLFYEQTARSFHLIDDPALNAYLNRVAQRLLKSAPPSPYHYRLQLMDQPYTNAFGTPGGRIYVARKAALLAKNEDELAGLVAHELAHIYTRQLGVDYTRIFHDMLGVNQIGDRADVTRKYNQLLDTQRTKKFTVKPKHQDQEQLVADQTAIYLMARAGYKVSAFADYYDRLAETRGRTGGFWSDFFGTTPPESKRLRAILDTASSLPASCVSGDRPPEQEFAQWKQMLLEWSAPAQKDSVRDVLLQTKFYPPLLSDIQWLRFSADGSYILAQDDSTVSVLTRKPFAFLFRATLPDHPVSSMFSPDSKLLITGSQSGRVEKWDLISFKRVSVTELSLGQSCLESKLATDGNTFACYRTDGGLQLLDAATGKVIFEKKDFYTPTVWDLLNMLLAKAIGAQPHLVNLDYSPDARYFIAGSHENVIVLDLKSKSPVPIHGELKDDLGFWFGFAGNDRVVAGNRSGDARLLAFPAGNVIYKFQVGAGNARGVTQGDTVVISPAKEYAGVLYDMAAAKFTRGLPNLAFDMYGPQFVAENRDGQILLGDVADGNWVASARRVQLPAPQLGNVRVLSVSDDLHWLALSQTTRGGLFDLKQGSRLQYLRRFNGAWISSDHQLWADFPKYNKAERMMACFNMNDGDPVSTRKIDTEQTGRQSGPYFLAVKDNHKSRTLEVHDVKTDAVLWSRELKDNPDYHLDLAAGTMLMMWSASSQDAKNAAKSDQVLSAKLNQIKGRENSDYFEVLDAQTGKLLAHIAIDTGKGSFTVEDSQATANFLGIMDNEGRVHVYSLTGDDEPNVIFGEGFDLSRGGLLLVQTDEHHLQVLDAKTMEPIDEYGFQSPLAAARFLADGTRLIVLTRDQTAYVLRPTPHHADEASLPPNR